MNPTFKRRPAKRPVLAAVAITAVLVGGIAPTALQATSALPATSASATHPTVTLKATCNPATGLYDIENVVSGDPSYPNETATIVSQSRATIPTLVDENKPVKGSGTVSGTEYGVAITKSTEIVQTVKVQWTNHSKGDLVSQTGRVTVAGDCKKTSGPPEQSYSCTIIEGTYHKALELGTHINTDIGTVSDPSVILGQVNMYVDANIKASDYVTSVDLPKYAGNNDWGLRWKILGVEQTPIPLTVEQIQSGIITFTYGPKLKEALAKLGYSSWQILFVQTNETDKWPKYKCDETTKEASAEIVVKTVATCLEASTIEGALKNAAWETELIRTPGTHTAWAVADGDAKFPDDGSTRKSVTYTITAADPSLCPHNASASVQVVGQHGCLTGTELGWAISNAKWDSDVIDLTVGTHTRPATADTGIFFPDGSSTREVPYTVYAPDPSLCPKDASASIELDKKVTCLTAESYKATLVNATLDAPLPTTPGTHPVKATATKGHNFADGTNTFTQMITIAGAALNLCSLVNAGTEAMLPLSIALAAIVSGVLLAIPYTRRRIFGFFGKLFGRTSAA